MSCVLHWKCDCCGDVEQRPPDAGRPEHWHMHGFVLDPAPEPKPILLCRACQKALGAFLLERRKEYARSSDTMRVGKPIAP